MKRAAIWTVLCLGLWACSGGNDAQAVAQQSITTSAGETAAKRINAIRAAAGRAPLTRNAQLDAAARGHARDMAAKNFFGHKGSNGSTVGKRVRRAGYAWCTVGENIGKGQSSRVAAIKAWRQSAGHYRNIVMRDAREFGMAREGPFWVMVVAAKRC